MKIAIITDTHFGVRNESQVFLKNQEKMLKSFFNYIKENNIKTIYHGGDLFDNRKHVSSKLLNWVNENWVKPIHELDLTAYIIVGNHDTHYKNTNTPNTVYEFLKNDSRHTIVVDDIHEIILKDKGNQRVALVPWICDDNNDKILPKLQKEYYNLVLGHFEIKGMLMQLNVVAEHGINKNVLKNHDLVLSGHFHKKSKSNNINYLGSPLPYTWAESVDKHGWHVLHISDNELNLEFVEYPNTMYQRIVIDTEDKIDAEYNGADFVKVIVKNKNEFHFQTFIESLRQKDITQLQIIDETQEEQSDIEINEEELRDDLVTMINDHIDKTQEENKEELKALMKKLYAECTEI